MLIRAPCGAPPSPGGSGGSHKTDTRTHAPELPPHSLADYAEELGSLGPHRLHQYPSHRCESSSELGSTAMLNMLSRPTLHAYLIGGIMSRAYRP